MDDKELINVWIWDEYYERYFWKPVYYIPPKNLEVDQDGQLFEKDDKNKNVKIEL